MTSFCYACWIFHIINNPLSCIDIATRVAKAMIHAKVISCLRFSIFVLFFHFRPKTSAFSHLHQLSCKIPQGRYASGRLALSLHEGRFEAVWISYIKHFIWKSIPVFDSSGPETEFISIAVRLQGEEFQWVWFPGFLNRFVLDVWWNFDGYHSM